MYKKYGLLLSLAACVSPTYADVLVILPESGAMARAGDSIKRGFLSAYQASQSQEKIIMVDSAKYSMAQILKTQVNKNTKLIVGPLQRVDIENVMRLKPKVPVLALNDVNNQAANVWQFSLAKQQDAQALNRILKKDNIQKLWVYRQNGMEAATELYMMTLISEFGAGVEYIEQLPSKLPRKQGLLLLGQNDWIAQLGALPKKNIYATSLSIEQGQPIPQGLSFCDAPALYNGQWADMLAAYNKQPENMAFQRLLAFGGDAWTLSQRFLETPTDKNFSFAGRTGQIAVSAEKISRQPACYQQQRKGIVLIN